MRLDVTDETIGYVVRGSEPQPYEGELWFAPHGLIVSECDCPVNFDCKHALAALIRVLGEGIVRGERIPSKLRRLLPDEWQDRDVKLPPVEFEGEETLFRSAPAGSGDHTRTTTLAEAEQQARASRGREPQGAWWAQYVAADTETTRFRILQDILEKALKEAPSYIRYRYYPLWEVVRIEDPFESLTHFAEQIPPEAVEGRSKLARTMLENLKAFLKSPEAENQRRAWREKQAVESLRQWLESAQQESPASLKLTVVWDTVRYAGRPTLVYQVLQTSERLAAAPRSINALDQLRREHELRKRILPPAHARFLEWLMRKTPPVPAVDHANPNETRFLLQDLEAHCRLLRATGSLQWADGGVPELSQAPARLALRPAGGDMLEWCVLIPGTAEAPGEEVPLGEASLVTEHEPRGQSGFLDPNVFVRRGKFLYPLDPAGMPITTLFGLVALPQMPTQLFREGGYGRALIARLGQESLGDGGLVQEVQALPRLEAWLSGRWLTLCITAAATSGERFQYLPWSGWEDARIAEQVEAPEELETIQDAAPPPGEPGEPAVVETEKPSPHAVMLIPRREDVHELEEWLAEILPVSPQAEQCPNGLPGFRFRLGEPQIAPFIEQWARRPRKVEYLGNRQLANLVQLRSVPRLAISVEPSGLDMLSVSVAFAEEFRQISLEEVQQSLRSQAQQLVQLPSGGLYRREELEQLRSQAETLGALGLEINQAHQTLHPLQVAGDALHGLVNQTAQIDGLEAFRSNVSRLVRKFKGIPKARVPAKTARVLRAYQRDGVDFLAWSCQTFGGALLADDMGLGKTLQVLAALQALRKSSGMRLPSLVVCPASVVHNWKREAEKFTPELRVVVIERGTARREILERLKDFDLVVKNYALTRRDADILESQDWLAVCVDEAQAIKNPAAAITRAVKRFKTQYRIALTGTPIENRLGDLWSIMDFAVPGYLASQDAFESGMRRLDESLALRTLRARLRPVLLRRLKGEVAPELPPRIEERRDCALEPRQRSLYLRELKATRLILEGGGAVAGRQRIQILAALTRLRQICCDPAVLGFAEAGSGKTAVLLETLAPLLERGEKVLVVSQFVRVLQNLKRHIEGTGARTYLLTGQTTGRQALVERFESDPEPAVFLISLKAGGTGLNLVSASNVILFDPWWNPAVEAQAIDRTHRIGQTRSVLAIRLVAENTIEERILDLQERKRELVRNVLDSESFNRSLTREDFDYLLSE